MTSLSEQDLINEVTTRLLCDQKEVKEYDSKYRAYINHEFQKDFIDLNAILTFSKYDTDYEIYLKGLHINDKYDELGHNVSVVWGMSDKDNSISDFDNKVQDIARIIIKDVVEKLLTKLEDSLNIFKQQQKAHASI